MKYIALPDDKTRILPFYLAMEEYVAYNIDEEDCFFMWQVEPTVIFGRNQLIENEVNLEYCRVHNIQTYRRKSGGGCVYADAMISSSGGGKCQAMPSIMSQAAALSMAPCSTIRIWRIWWGA